MLPPNSGLAQYNSRRRVSWVAATPIRPMFLPWSMAPKWDPGSQPGLRKAYGIGICSVEEIGSFAEPVPSSAGVEEAPTPTGQWQERQLRRAQSPRPPLPAHPPESTESLTRLTVLLI